MSMNCSFRKKHSRIVKLLESFGSLSDCFMNLQFSFGNLHSAPALLQALRRRSAQPRCLVALLHRSPNAVDIIVIVERLEEFADLGKRGVVEIGKLLRYVTQFAGHH